MDVSPYQSTLELLHFGFLLCLILAVVFFIVSMVLFFLFDIPLMIRRHLGIEAKESIEEFREKNEPAPVLPLGVPPEDVEPLVTTKLPTPPE